MNLSFSVSEPLEAAVHCLEFSGGNSIIDYACSGGVVCLDGGFWMGPFHFLQCLSHFQHLLSCYEKWPEFCFINRGYDKFNNFGKCWHGSVQSGHGVVFRKENVSSRSAVSFALIVKTCIIMCTQDHIAGAIENAIGGVGGTVIKYLIDVVIGVLRGGFLL